MVRVLIMYVIFSTSFNSFSQCSVDDKTIFSTIINSILSSEKKMMFVRTRFIDEMEPSVIYQNDFRTPSGEYWLSRTNFSGEEDTIMRKLIRGIYKSNYKRKFNSRCLPLNAAFFNDTDLNRIFKKSVDSGWGEFHRKFPSVEGIISFSMIHYSEDKKYAAVYYSFLRRGLDGFTSIALLKKGEDDWLIWNEMPVSVN